MIDLLHCKKEVIIKSNIKGEKIGLMKRGFYYSESCWYIKSCSCLQQSRFGVALPVVTKPQPEGGPATERVSERLECSVSGKWQGV
jgi:hypothetical protein